MGVIVLNATGSKLFAEIFVDQLRYETGRKSEGRLMLNSLTIPVVFSGMVTGLGQMDSFSKERLANDLKALFAKNI